MKVNGFQIKQELKMVEPNIEALQQELTNSYAKMPNDTSVWTLQAVIDDLPAAERRKALYQTAQAQYNQLVLVKLSDQTVSLAYIIKMEGVVNRLVKVWKDTSKQAASAVNFRHGLDPNQKYPVSQVDTKQCLENTRKLMAEATMLQGHIGTSNGREENLVILDKATA